MRVFGAKGAAPFFERDQQTSALDSGLWANVANCGRGQRTSFERPESEQLFWTIVLTPGVRMMLFDSDPNSPDELRDDGAHSVAQCGRVLALLPPLDAVGLQAHAARGQCGT